MKPECSVTQSSAMTQPYKWEIADVLSRRGYLLHSGRQYIYVNNLKIHRSDKYP